MDDPILLPDGSPSLLLDDSPAPELTPEQVYQDYAPRVYTVARRMVRNDLDAEDVALTLTAFEESLEQTLAHAGDLQPVFDEA